MNTCKNCKFKVKNPMDKMNLNSYMCIESPPGVVAISQPVNIPGQGIGQQISINPIYPPVSDESIACSKFQETEIKLVK